MSTPKWRDGPPVNRWIELQNTAFSNASGAEVGIFAFGGGGPGATGWWAFGGGHSDSGNNGVWYLDLTADVPAWAQRRAATSPATPDEADYYGDGRPSSRHTYQTAYEIAARSRFMTFTANSVSGTLGTTAFPTVDGFNPATNDWDAAGTWTSAPTGSTALSGAMCKAQDGTENVYIVGGSNNKLQRWNQAANTWTEIGTDVVNTSNIDCCAAHDPIRNRIVLFTGASGAKYDLNSSGAESTVTFTGLTSQVTYATWGWDPGVKLFIGKKWGAGTVVHQCDPTSFAVTAMSVGGAAPPAPTADGYGELNERFAYIPKFGGWLYLPRWDVNAWFLPTIEVAPRGVDRPWINEIANQRGIGARAALNPKAWF